MAGPPSGSRTGGRPGYGAGGDGPAAVPAAADRTERVRRPGGGQAGGTPPPPAAGGPAGAGRAGDPGRSLVRPGGGGGGPTRHPGGLLQRVRRPAGGLCRCGGEPGTLGWAAPGGEAAGLCPGGPAGGGGPGREGGALPDPAQLDGPGDGGAAARAAAGAVWRGLAGAGAPRDKGGAEWRSEPSSWNT